jgi:hypothetical protein
MTTYTMPTTSAALNQNNTAGYRWAVHAQDAVGNMGAGDMLNRFYVFSGLTPTRDQLLTDTTPTFTWTGVSGAGAAQWRLEIGTDPAMSALVYSSPLLPATAITYTLPNASALTSGVYYWRVYRTVENTSTIQGQAFYIGVASSITPVLVSPVANGWFNAEQMATGVTFTWLPQAAGVPSTSAFADSYELQIANASTFAAGTIVYSGESSSTSLPPALSLVDGTYYWRVRGHYGLLNGPFSAARTIRIDQTYPTRPALTAPVGSAVLSTRTPTFTWTAATGTPAQYVFEIDNDGDLSNPMRSVTLSASTLTYTVPAAQALPNGTYVWRVRAVDAAGNAGISFTRTLTIAAP